MFLSRRQLIKLSAAAAAGAAANPLALLAAANPFKFDGESNVIKAPDDPEQWPEFRRELHAWRRAKREQLNYSDTLYLRRDFEWVARNFACGFLMTCDLLFFSPGTPRSHAGEHYDVAGWLGHMNREFGGIDSVVLWHAYPRIGLDDRNQFDFYRDMQGGLEGVRSAVRKFHKADVRVYIDYNPWDEKTRREAKSDVETIADLVAALEADGIFLDTLDRGATNFRNKLDTARPGVALESELALALERVRDHHMSWAQWFDDSRAPGVLRNKWFERRHMQHQIARWSHDHSAELHQAWMNGSGMLIWENVFGSFNGWNDRDKSILRSMLPIQRRFWRLFSGENWTPLVPTLATDVYASLWEGDGLQLYTLVNRSDREAEGKLLPVRVGQDQQAWDLIRGEMAGPGYPAISGVLPPRGIGCFVIGQAERFHPSEPAVSHPPGSFVYLISTQRDLWKRAQWDTTPPKARTILRSTHQPWTTLKVGRVRVVEGMVRIPATSRELKVGFRMRECGCYESGGPFPGQPGHPGLHKPVWFKNSISLKSYWIDRTLVTNAQYASFLKETAYKPHFEEKFLAHWRDGAPPLGKEDHPVVYVDLWDAIAYAAWLGKRLPTEEEWQYAAQGDEERKYPWGNEMTPNRCNDGTQGGTTPVTAYPDGRSPFGLFDMCGNVWQWTHSERTDSRTRFAILRGGSFYQRGGSDWYFDEGPQPAWFAAKMLLMGPRLDRCFNLGFRCAADG